MAEFSESIVEQAWRRSGEKYECTRSTHGHSGRCNKLLMKWIEMIGVKNTAGKLIAKVRFTLIYFPTVRFCVANAIIQHSNLTLVNFRQ